MRVKHKEQIKQKQNRNKHGKVKKKKKEIMFFLLYHYSGLQKKKTKWQQKEEGCWGDMETRTPAHF